MSKNEISFSSLMSEFIVHIKMVKKRYKLNLWSSSAQISCLLKNLSVDELWPKFIYNFLLIVIICYLIVIINKFLICFP